MNKPWKKDNVPIGNNPNRSIDYCQEMCKNDELIQRGYLTLNHYMLFMCHLVSVYLRFEIKYKICG